MVKVVQVYEAARINQRTKEVKTDGHGEATHGHELHLRVAIQQFHEGHPLICIPLD
jgi:hypothetical protein